MADLPERWTDPAMSYGCSMARLIRVETRGRVGWMFEPPAACPDGHTSLQQCWLPCEACRTACIHWRCRHEGCKELVRDPDHEHCD